MYWTISKYLLVEIAAQFNSCCEMLCIGLFIICCSSVISEYVLIYLVFINLWTYKIFYSRCLCD